MSSLLMGFGDKESLDTETQLRKGAVIRNGKGGREQKGQKGLSGRRSCLSVLSYSVICRRHSGNGGDGWPN